MDTNWDRLIKDHEGHAPERCVIEAMAWADDYLANMEHQLEYPDRATVGKIRQQLKQIAKKGKDNEARDPYYAAKGGGAV